MQILTQGDGMRKPDPPIANSQLLGKVSFVLRDGRLIEPSKGLGLSRRAVAALVRRSSTAARVVVGVHNVRRNPEQRTQEPNPCQG
jgi:hypothetical protein